MKSRILGIGEASVYHVISRTAYARFSFEAKEKEVFRALMKKQARFCGVEILTFCIMSNHFHILVKVKKDEPVDDVELVKRYRILYGDKPNVFGELTPDALTALLNVGGKDAEAIRRRLIARMGNLSVFVKELKQRFSIWYNREHGNQGTLWSARFKSVLVEDAELALKMVAAYIDLNPVRAGICELPEEYSFTGWGSACNGDDSARVGFLQIYTNRDWDEIQSAYSLLLAKFVEVKSACSPSETNNVNKLEDLPVAFLKKRNRLFSRGGVLGSGSFIESWFILHKEHFGDHRPSGAKTIRSVATDQLMSLRQLK